MRKRAAYCVLRVVVLCAALVDCTNTQTEVIPPSPVGGPTKAECHGDTEPAAVASGWKLMWQKVFEGDIARPPMVDGSQLILLERIDPLLPETRFRDTLWVLDSQTTATQWKFGDAQLHRHITHFKLSPKYMALVVRDHPASTASSSSDAVNEYPLVLERLSGREIISDTTIGIEALSDDAIYHLSFGRALNRVDLPTGTQRWHNPDTAASWGALLVNGGELYSIGFNKSIYHYNPMDGHLVEAGTLGAGPGSNDFVIQDDILILRSWYEEQGYVGVTAFDLRSMSKQWAVPVNYPPGEKSNAFGEGDLPTFSTTSNSIYLFDTQNNLLRIELATGRTLWRVFASDAEAMSRPVVIDGLVYGLFADGIVKAFSASDGSTIGMAMKVPLWYWRSTDDAQEWRDLFGGLSVSGDTLIVTTGCRSVYAIQRAP